MRSAYPVATKLQTTVLAVLLALPIIGVYVDGWHHHHLHAKFDTFFNPYHLVLYSGAAAASLFVILIAIKNGTKGFSFSKSLPKLFIPAAWGMLILTIAAVCDLIWHHYFGFEASVDALLSPPHMALALGGMLAVGCIIRPIWNPELRKTTGSIAPILGFSYFFLIFVFFTQYAQPYYHLWLSEGVPVVGGDSYTQAAALAGGLLRTVIFCGMLFSTIKTFKFPVGSLFILLLAEGIGIGLMGGQLQYILSAAMAGALTEIVYYALYDHLKIHGYLRLFGALVPVAFFLPYIFVSLENNSTWWSIHMVAGLLVVNAIAGWLLTYIIEPPAPISAAE